LLGIAATANVSAALVALDGDGFTAVYDDSISSLFGNPTLSGDGKTILFSPTAFTASAGGVNTQFTTSSVNVDIIPDAGFRLNGVDLLENGDYRLVKRSIGGIDPSVSAFGELRLTNLQTAVDFVTNNFTAGNLTAICPNAGCAATQWSASAELLSPEAWEDVSVRVRLENTLVAESFAIGDSAFIEKKHATQTIGITPFFDDGNPVPVPGAVWLFGSAFMGLLASTRNRCKKYVLT
jgi:hypothetical protein